MTRFRLLSGRQSQQWNSDILQNFLHSQLPSSQGVLLVPPPTPVGRAGGWWGRGPSSCRGPFMSPPPCIPPTLPPTPAGVTALVAVVVAVSSVSPGDYPFLTLPSPSAPAPGPRQVTGSRVGGGVAGREDYKAACEQSAGQDPQACGLTATVMSREEPQASSHLHTSRAR